jgi:hypothetical protein
MPRDPLFAYLPLDQLIKKTTSLQLVKEKQWSTKAGM